MRNRQYITRNKKRAARIAGLLKDLHSETYGICFHLGYEKWGCTYYAPGRRAVISIDCRREVRTGKTEFLVTFSRKDKKPQQHDCPVCNGRGETAGRHVCRACKGSGRMEAPQVSLGAVRRARAHAAITTPNTRG